MYHDEHVTSVFKCGNDAGYSDGGWLACGHKLLPSSKSEITSRQFSHSTGTPAPVRKY